MTKRFCFFCGSPDLVVGITKAYEEGAVPCTEVIRQCEQVFGVKTSKLETSDTTGDFLLLNTVGFHTIYGITRNHGADGSDNERLNVTCLNELNAFLRAETIEDKKVLFLTHCKSYIQRFLDQKGIEPSKQDIFAPILDYAAQQFHLASYALLHDGLKQTLKGDKRFQRIQNLQKIGSYVTALLLIGIDIKDLDEKKLNYQTLERVVKRADQLIIPNGSIALGLGYQTPITRDNAIAQTLELSTRSEDDLPHVVVTSL